MKHTLSAGLFLLAFTPLVISQPVFAPPVNLGPVINTSSPESDPFWDGPRNRLYFVRDFDIWYAHWNGISWDPPVKLGPQINTGPAGELSPSISADGQKLYFVSDAREGYLWDIWVSTWNSSFNDWGTPVNLGPPVNTPDVEFSAHIVPDGRLFFSSSADPDSSFPFGRCGIYASHWNGSFWSVPQPQWGCGEFPEYPSVPANGQWLYFDEGIGQINVVAWDGLNWVLPAYNLNMQLGGRASAPFITWSGDSLFFAGTTDLGGFGGGDIWVANRTAPSSVSGIRQINLFFLVVVLVLAGIYWATHLKLDSKN